VERDPSRLLAELVSRPSVNPMGQSIQRREFGESAVTDYLEDYFRALSVDYTRQAVLGDRANIVARYQAANARRTLLFEVHQDTVPADGMKNPFIPRIEGGRLHGRGACDVKGGMAAILTMLARLIESRPTHTHVIVACTVDEEHLGLGVQHLVKTGIQADAAIVAEPTNLDIVNCHKGLVRWRTSTAGRAWHSSEPEQGTNAIHRMAAVLIAIEQYAEWLRTSPADPVLGPATVNVGRITGGSAVNIVPDWCTIEIDRRLLPGEDAQRAQREMEQYIRKTVPFEVAMEKPWTWLPALSSEQSERLVEQLGVIIEAVSGGVRVRGVAFGTDASTIAAASIPAVVFGPGDIAQAHTSDEWIVLEQVEKAAEILYRFVADL
jgi:acetylornithine deacetylase/succinyl-diaminopimelate desuccinylase family protein